MRVPRTHCKKGHRFTPLTTKFSPNGKGNVCRSCKICISERVTLRYHSDPEYRAKRLARSVDYQRRRRAALTATVTA